MRNRPLAVLSSAFVVLFLSALWSCGSDSGSPTKPDPDPDPDPDPVPLSHAWTPDVVGLPPADSAVLDSAATRYRTLRLAGDAAAAGTALVTALKGGWDGVADAAITPDGSTIQMRFTDGVMAIITTDELFQAETGSQSVGGLSDRSAPAVRQGSPGGTTLRAAGGPLANSECIRANWPNSQRVNIALPALGTGPRAEQIGEDLADHLVELGWNREDLDIRRPDLSGGHRFIPEDLTKHEGASAVFIVADGVIVRVGSGAPSGGTETFAIQAFDGGRRTSYGDRVTPERWARYEQWQAEGKLIHGKAWSATSQSLVDQVYMRADLLAEEVEFSASASVHFISPRSGRRSNLEGMTKTGGAASATGWDGRVNPWDATASLKQLTDHMAGRNERPRPLSDAVTTLRAEGKASYDYAGETSTLVVETLSDDPLFLPAQMDFDAPFNCLEQGTVYYDVDVTYPDCPDLNQSFDFFPGGEHSLAGICPVGAEISFRAMDEDGKVVGAGIYELGLAGGGNQVDLCPCWGKVDTDFSGVASVPGVDEGAQLQLQVNYTDPQYPQATLELDVSTLTDRKGWESLPGEAKVVQTLVDGAGNVLGYAEEEEVDLRCDANETSDPCFGWIEVTDGQVPAETSNLIVKAESDHDWIEPTQESFSSGDQATLTGLMVGDNVHISALALSSTQDVLGTVSFDQVIGCGPNQVSLDFNPYGITLYTSRLRAPASGYAGSFIIGNVREWQEGDTDEPTGPGLPGVEVHVSTDLGGFQTAPLQLEPQVTKTTNEWGGFGLFLMSTDMGTATVSAHVDEPDLEADPLTVEFERPVRLVINNSSEPYDGTILPDSTEAIRQFCVTYQKWNNGEMDSESIEAGRGPAAYVYSGHHVVGEELRFVWAPGTNCEADDFYKNGPYINGAYLHYYFGENYAGQITKQMIGEQNPLDQTVEFTHTLLTPGGQQPSPFDLSAPERYVLSGFRQF